MKIEKTIIGWINNRIRLVSYVGITITAIILRYSLLDFVSGDYIAALEPWYYEIKELGGLYGLAKQVGDYNMLYQTIIALSTYLPINPLHFYKLVSIVFDFCIAGLVAYIVKEYLPIENGDIFAYAAILFTPTVFLNSAGWAQCDVIYTFFVLLAVLLLYKEKNIVAFIMYGIAISFKLQAIFALPLFVFIYLFWNEDRSVRISVLHFFIIPLVLILSGTICYIMGRTNILSAFRIYLHQTIEYKSLTMNYPSLWCLTTSVNMDEAYYDLRIACILTTIIVLGTIMLRAKKKQASFGDMIILLFIMVYSCVLILPSMHERYGYMYEILAIIICFFDKKTIIPCIGLESISLQTYGHFLYGNPINLQVLAAINVCIYIYYATRILSKNHK